MLWEIIKQLSVLGTLWPLLCYTLTRRREQTRVFVLLKSINIFSRVPYKVTDANEIMCVSTFNNNLDLAPLVSAERVENGSSLNLVSGKINTIRALLPYSNSG